MEQFCQSAVLAPLAAAGLRACESTPGLLSFSLKTDPQDLTDITIFPQLYAQCAAGRYAMYCNPTIKCTRNAEFA